MTTLLLGAVSYNICTRLINPGRARTSRQECRAWRTGRGSSARTSTLSTLHNSRGEGEAVTSRAGVVYQKNTNWGVGGVALPPPMQEGPSGPRGKRSEEMGPRPATSRPDPNPRGPDISICQFKDRGQVSGRMFAPAKG